MNDAALQALADQSRRDMLEALRGGEQAAGALGARLHLSQPGVSKHLRVLRKAGLVRVRKDAQRRLYSLSPEPLAELDTWLSSFRQLWSDRLDALERHLDREV